MTLHHHPWVPSASTSMDIILTLIFAHNSGCSLTYTRQLLLPVFSKRQIWGITIYFQSSCQNPIILSQGCLCLRFSLLDVQSSCWRGPNKESLGGCHWRQVGVTPRSFSLDPQLSGAQGQSWRLQRQLLMWFPGIQKSPCLQILTYQPLFFEESWPNVKSQHTNILR